MNKGTEVLIKSIWAQAELFGCVELTPDEAAELIAALERAQQKADVYDMLREDYGLCEKHVGLADFVDRQAKRIAELEAASVKPVKLPDHKDIRFWPGSAFEFDTFGYVMAVEEAIRAAGGSVEGSE